MPWYGERFMQSEEEVADDYRKMEEQGMIMMGVMKGEYDSSYGDGRFEYRFSLSSKTVFVKKMSSSLPFLPKYLLPQLIMDSSVILCGFFLLSGNAPRNMSPFIASRK
jgi:hypothetical protein